MLGTAEQIWAKCKFDVVFKRVASRSPLHFMRISMSFLEKWSNIHWETSSVSQNKSYSAMSYTKISSDTFILDPWGTNPSYKSKHIFKIRQVKALRAFFFFSRSSERPTDARSAQD